MWKNNLLPSGSVASEVPQSPVPHLMRAEGPVLVTLNMAACSFSTYNTGSHSNFMYRGNSYSIDSDNSCSTDQVSFTFWGVSGNILKRQQVPPYTLLLNCPGGLTTSASGLAPDSSAPSPGSPASEPLVSSQPSTPCG